MRNDIDESAVANLPGAIAIVGMAGRFPGARNLEEFRRNLENGVESITVFSDRDLLQAGIDRALLSNPNYVKAAPLLEDADRFDAAFFEYSPREAAIMDPQQRLFLECSWEALEDAGHAGDAYGSATGVFSGGGGIMSTYLLSDTHFNPRLTGTTASMQHVGNDKDYLSTRVSYKLNLRGPSLAVQTACSTSLVAVHLACQSLLTGECDMALAGGTTVRIPQRTGYLFKEGNVFSRDGHCRTFDADAQGTVFGSGIGVVVLKRLKDALRDRDAIRAVIRGTAIVNDGSEKKTSYWAPHAPGQADAMRKALAVARVDPSTIGYVEAHGTATRLGDPTEVRALRDAFGPMRGARCALGSVKSNIGHPESAAGVAGLIKAVLSLEHKVLYPSLNYTKPNPEIDFGEAFYVNTTRQAWDAPSHPRRAGVNSLGIGGTNAFVILEEAPAREAEPVAADRPWHVLTLSAKSPEALAALAQRFNAHLDLHSTEPLGDICWSTNVGRAHFAHRLAVVASSSEEAARLVVSTQPQGQVASGHVQDGRRPRVAFLFTGQGSQHVGMARELYQTQKAFRDAFDQCAEKLSPELPLPLARVLYPDGNEPSPIDETAYTQPALFALEYALAAMWRSWGIEPSVLIGHSVGEIVAACVAGVIALDDALRLVAGRGRLMQALPRGGGMAAIRCEPARVAEAISPYRDTVSIAAVNSPADVVISGRQEHVDAVASGFDASGVTVTRLKVSHAFHSPLMDPMLDEFAQVARSVAYTSPAIPLISNVSGALAGEEVTTPEYWVRHVRESVRFADGMAAVHAHGADVFLEIGPSPVLVGLARPAAPAGPLHAWLPSLRPGRSDWRQIAESLAALYVRGAAIDWTAFDRDYSRQRVHLPTYAFQRQRYWIDAAPSPALPAPGSRVSLPLLGQRLRLPHSSEIRFEAQWSAHAPAYLDDHRIFDTVVVPGASHLAMALAAMKEATGQQTCVLEDVVFPQALTLPDDGGAAGAEAPALHGIGSTRTAQLVVTREKDGDKDGRSAFQVLSLLEGADESGPDSWVAHATGTIRRHTPTDTAAGVVDLLAWRAGCTRPTTGTAFYDRFWQSGYHLRGAFRWIANTWTGHDESLCELEWPDLPDDPSAYPLYPSLIDSCFQCVFSGQTADLLREGAVYVPFSIRRFAVVASPRPGARLWCHVATSQPDDGRRNIVDADITLCDDTGRIIASIEGCQLREIRRDALVQEPGTSQNDLLYEVAWHAAPRPTLAARIDADEPGTWIVFADVASKVGDGLIEQLRSRQQRCIRVMAGPQYQRVATDEYELNGAAPGDLRQLLDDALGRNRPGCRGIVHMWSLDVPPMDDASNASARERVGGSVLHLVQALARTEWSLTPRVWLVTRGAQPVEPSPGHLAIQQAPLWGLGQVIALEHPELSCTRVDLDRVRRVRLQPDLDAQQLFEDVWAPDQEDQLAYRHGERYVPRLVRSVAQAARTRDDEHARPGTEPFQVGLTAYGQLENLTVRPLTRRAPGPGEVEIEVRATGLNFRDVLNALGLLSEHYARHLGVTSASEMTFGFECAGTVTAVGPGVSNLAPGDDVIAVASHEALGTFITLRTEFVTPKPDSLTFEEAAALPLAFLTVYYGLHSLARLQPGERVLIHAAAGGVGLACVRWAQHVGAEVFATASPAKWPFLQSAGVRHVMNSRTLDFGAAVMDLTGGTGVDVVVNSLSGDFVDESFRVLGAGGRFVELGKRGVWSEEDVRRRRLDVSYFPFDLVEVARQNPSAVAAMLAEMGARVRAGTWTPLPHTVFPVSKVTDAFRYMAEARHIGKIVVAMPPAATGDTDWPVAIREDATYLITGGLGALGLEIANWLVQQGARHLVLASRRRVADGAEPGVERLRRAGATVLLVEADVSDAAQVKRLLSATRDGLPPLGGIVHAAGVLDDGVLLQQTWDRFQRVMAPKVEGTWNLHVETRGLPLDFFVCFSSIASLIGNAGQGNYAAANAFMDALAHDRRARGLPALSVNWGPWGEVGMAAEGSEHRRRRLADQGFRPIAPEQGLQVFSQLLRSTRAQVGVLQVSWPELLRIHSAGHAFFERVAPQKAAQAPARAPDMRKQLTEAADPRRVLTHHVRSVVGAVLGMGGPGEIDARARLFDLGLESLMAVEMRWRFEESLGCPLRPTLLFDYPTIEALVDHLAAQVIARPDVPPPADPKPVVESHHASTDDLENLDEDELADRLARELWTTPNVQAK